MNKHLLASFLSIIHLISFSQSSKLWITAQANSGTSEQVDADLMIINGASSFDLSSSDVICTSTADGNKRVYHITIKNDYDNNGSIDQVAFDLVVKGYENSTIVYSESENASSMTALGTEVDISIGGNVWGVNSSDNNSDVDEGETMIFSIENITTSNLAAKYEPKFEGFNTMRFEEPNGSREHKIIIGEGTGLASYLMNYPIDYELLSVDKIVVTGAGSFIEGGTHEWALSSINFSITIDDTESGGFNDLDDYSLFSNASNFGGSYPAQTRDVPKSEFCWDKVPRWIAFRSLSPLTNAEVTDVASNYQIVMLEKANNQGTDYVDDGMIAVATRLKAENPKITTLFYWNSWIHYGGYRANDDYDANAWSDLGTDGQPEMFKDLWYTYNYDEEGMRNWWVNAAHTAMESDVLDGVFVDKMTASNLIEPFTESGEPKNNYARMLKDLYDGMPEGKVVIGNSLGTERVNSNRGLFSVMDGSYLERWAYPGTALDEAEAIAISIQTMREALSKGKVIHLQTSPHDTGGGLEPDDYAGKVQYAKDNVNYALAVYLIIAEENAYFSYTSSVNANPFGNEAWNTSFIDEFSYRLGPPLGPPTKDGYVYQRSFENVDVWLDVSTKEAVLDWKDKTKITNTECTTVTGIDSKTESLIEVFPNPTTGIIHFSQESDYQISDALGNSIESGFGESADLSSLGKGIYFVSISNESGATIQKIIKE